MHDAIIVGCGPAGNTLAWRLARHGLKPLLIENVAVSPAWQGLGLGRRLMAHAERLAAAMGYGEIRLYANARFAENVAFYQRLGYAITREAPYLGGRVAHMSKRLGAA